MKVSLRKVTSKYLQDIKVKARRKYEVEPHPNFPNLGYVTIEPGTRITIRHASGSVCAHLSGNEVTKWTVHED